MSEGQFYLQLPAYWKKAFFTDRLSLKRSANFIFSSRPEITITPFIIVWQLVSMFRHSVNYVVLKRSANFIFSSCPEITITPFIIVWQLVFMFRHSVNYVILRVTFVETVSFGL